MVVNRVFLCVVLLALAGCAASPPEQSGEQPLHVVRIEVMKADEHLGHNITEGNVHTVWCDGCMARIVETGEPFVIFWMNNEIKDYPFQFKDGQTRTLWYTGSMDDGIMGYEGKCLHVGQIVKIE